MKNNFLVLVAVFGMLSLASCKKDWTCTCVTTDSNGDEIASNSYRIENETANEAETICDEGSSSVLGVTTECNVEVF